MSMTGQIFTFNIFVKLEVVSEILDCLGGCDNAVFADVTVDAFHISIDSDDNI